MEEDSNQVWFYCHSEKESSACCGYACDISDGSISEEDLYNSFLNNSDLLDEAFREMAPEFGPGIDQAESLLKNGAFSSLGDAIKEVFGHFSISCEVDGVNRAINWDIDDLMYSVIFEWFGVES